MRKTVTAALFAVAALAAGFLSCSGGDGNRTVEVPVGAVLPLSGQNASTGLNMKNAMELALSELAASPLPGGKKIRLLAEDSESSSEGAEAAYRKAIKAGAVAVLGPFSSSSTKRVIPVAHENGVVSFSPTSAASGLSAMSEFAFRASLTVERLVPPGITATRARLGYTKVAVITDAADTFSQSNLAELKKAFAAQGITIVSEQSYARSQEDPLPDLTELMTSIRDAEPEAVFVSALPPGRRAVTALAKRLDIKAPLVFTLITAEDVRAAREQEPGAGEGLIAFTTWFSGIDTPQNRAFVESYRKKYGAEPDNFAALSYEAARILARAVAAASPASPRAVRAAMAAFKAPDTLFGEFYFDSDGDAVYSPVIATVKNGRFETF